MIISLSFLPLSETNEILHSFLCYTIIYMLWKLWRTSGGYSQEMMGFVLQGSGKIVEGCLTLWRISGGYSYKDNKTNQEVLLSM